MPHFILVFDASHCCTLKGKGEGKASCALKIFSSMQEIVLYFLRKNRLHFMLI